MYPALTLVVLLYSTTAQAIEYRKVNTEVKAEKILKHIESDKDINLINCRIIGLSTKIQR